MLLHNYKKEKQMVDNIKLIKSFIKPKSEDSFYYLQIIQRRKENPDMKTNSRTIKTYCVNSIDYLESHYEEIKAICDSLNARAMINLNQRSYYKTAYKNLENIAGVMSNFQFDKINKCYERACGQGHDDNLTKWILDVDQPFTDFQYRELHKDIESFGGTILNSIPSASGYHIITSSFRLDQFKGKYPEIEVQKNNPTNLYIP